MKNKKNFLKKLAAVTLGFVMTLGVGAAGYSASAGEVKADTATITFKGLTSDSKYVTTETESTNGGVKFKWNNMNPSSGQTRGNQTSQSNMLSGANFYVFNTEAVGGSITKLELKTTASGTNKFVPASIYAAVGTSQFSSLSTTSGTAGSGSNTYCSWTFTGNNTYFAIGMQKGGCSGTVAGVTLDITYSNGGTVTKTLSSIAITSNTHRNFTVGDDFVGETVTATYSDSTTATVTATYSGYNMSTAGTQTVTASYSEGGVDKTAQYQITVTAGGGGDEGEQLVITSSSLNIQGTTGSSGAIQSETTYGIYTFGPGGSNKINNQSTNTSTNSFKKDTNDGAILIGKSGAYIYNHTAFDADIKKIEIYANLSASPNVQVSLDVGTTELNTAISSNHEFAETLSTLDSVYTAVDNLATGYGFFRFQVNSAHNAQVQFRITFHPEGTKHSVTYAKGATDATGTPPTQADVVEGKTFTVAANTFSRTGYSFDGWSDGSSTYQPNSKYTMGTSDVTLTAQWEANSYNLAYDANGGTGTVAGGSHAYGSTFNLSSSTFTKSGYTQDGWATSADGAKAYGLGGSYTWNTAGAVTLYAHWVPNEYTITFNNNGGSGSANSITADYNSDVTLPSSGFSKDHYDFDGWATTADGTKAYDKGAQIKMPLNGATLYAHYSLQMHFVTYDGNGGTPSEEEDILYYGDPVDLTVDAEKPGYIFQGWALPGGDIVLSQLTMGDDDITLHAVWVEDEKTYAFTVYPNDGISSQGVKVGDYKNGETVVMPDPEDEDYGFTRSGYTALGWSTSTTGDVEYEIGEEVTMGDSALNVYVVWQRHLDGKPVLTLSGSTEMWVGKTQTLTVTYTSGAVTMVVESDNNSVISLHKDSDSNGTAVYTVTAVGEGSATITAGDSFYSDSVTISAEEDGLNTLTIAGSLPSGTYYEGHTLSIDDVKSGLSISGKMKSGDDAVITSSNVSWKFADNSTEITLTNGMTEVSVKAVYSGVTSNQLDLAITVTPVTMESLTVNYTGGSPYLGVDFTFAGSITANYNDSSTAPVAVGDVNIGEVSKFITTQQTITIEHKTTHATGTFNVQYQVKSYTQDEETPGSASWTANKNDNLYKNQSSTSGTLDVGIFSFNWEHNGYNGWGGDTDGHRLGQSTTGSITFTSSTPTNVKITGITVVCGGNKSASSGSTTVSVGSTQKTPINFSGAGNADREFTFEKATGAIEIEVSCNSLFRMKGITINYVTVEQKSSTEKHAIRIGDVACTKSPLIAGESLNINDFNIQVQYDTSANFENNLKPTEVSPTTIVAGESTYRVTYTGSYGDTVHKDIQLTAQAAAVLSSITISKDTPCDDVFNRLDDFTHEGIHVIAHYTDSTTYPDVDVTESATITPPDMTTAGTKEVSVSYTEGGVTKDTSYSITVNAIHTTSLTLVMKDNSQNVVSEGDDGFYEIQPGMSYSLAFTGNGDYDSVSVTGGSEYTKVVGNTTLSSTSTTNEEVTFTATCDQASLPIKVRVIAAKTVTLDSLTTASKGASASTNENSGSFSGFITNTASIEITTLNYANPVLDDSELPSALSLSGSFSSGKYTGTITANAVYSGTFKLYVSESGGSDSEEISLSFSVVEDTIQSIKATGYQTNYTVGDSFNYSMTVTATYASTSTRVLDASEYDVDAPALTSRGNKTVTVTLDGTSVQDQFDITVAKPGNLNIVTSYEIPGEGSYQLVKDASNLSAGDQILIVGVESGTYYSLAPYTDGDNNCKRNEVATPVNDAIKGECTPITLGGEEDAWTLYDGAYYLYAAGGSSSNHLKGRDKADVDTALWTIECDAEGVATIKCVANISKNWLRHNTGSDLFSCYSSGQANVYIYKYVPGQSTYGYRDNTTISDELYDFVVAYSGENLTAKNWGTVFTSTEYGALDADDKALLKDAVVSSQDGTKVTSGLFADFITKYDEVFATNDGLINYLDRPIAQTYTIEIDYNHDGQTSTVKVLPGDYKLPEPPEYSGYVFQGWLVNGETKGVGSTITVSGDMTIIAQWAQGITFSSEFGFKFTGLDITRFQLIFNGTCPSDAEQYGFLYTKSDINLTSLTAKNIEAGVSGVGQVTGKGQAVLGTSYGYTEVSVVFYYIDGDGQVHYSEVITTSFDEMASKYDLNQITDPYARVCLEYYLANLDK